MNTTTPRHRAGRRRFGDRVTSHGPVATVRLFTSIPSRSIANGRAFGSWAVSVSPVRSAAWRSSARVRVRRASGCHWALPVVPVALLVRTPRPPFPACRNDRTPSPASCPSSWPASRAALADPVTSSRPRPGTAQDRGQFAGRAGSRGVSRSPEERVSSVVPCSSLFKPATPGTMPRNAPILRRRLTTSRHGRILGLVVIADNASF